MSSQLLTDTYKQVKKADLSKRTKCKSGASTSSLSEDLNILKQFDLNWEFGPCTGITRLQRWNRALKHGLNPPQRVKDLITQNLDDEAYTQSLWKDYDL